MFKDAYGKYKCIGAFMKNQLAEANGLRYNGKANSLDLHSANTFRFNVVRSQIAIFIFSHQEADNVSRHLLHPVSIFCRCLYLYYIFSEHGNPSLICLFMRFYSVSRCYIFRPLRITFWKLGWERANFINTYYNVGVQYFIIKQAIWLSFT